MADTNFTPQEIEQFLQQFFDVVGARQYVGARYVPIFGRAGSDTVEWDDGAPYEPLTVVMHQGVSYVSRRYVPAGIQVTDTAYWVETYRFNAQVEQYRQEVLSFQGQIDQIREDYVPFPDPDTYPKYGTAGQVLTTLTEGATMWDDPVHVTADVAGPLIDEWLDEHPEATTTVQDGSIGDVKLDFANLHKVFAYRGEDQAQTALTELTEMGLYKFTAQGARSDSPDPGVSFMLVYSPVYAGTNYVAQLFFTITNDVYLRIVNSSTHVVYRDWQVIASPAVLSSLFEARLLSSDVTSLATITQSGWYYATTATVAALTDKPTDLDAGLMTLLHLQGALGNANYAQQLMISQANTVWLRIVNTSTHVVTSDWVRLARYDQTPIVANMDDTTLTDFPNLSYLRTPGTYALASTWANAVLASAGNDFPSGCVNGIYSLQVNNAFNGNYATQYLTDIDNKTYVRTINRTTGAVYRDWKTFVDPNFVAPVNVLEGKKLVTAGDSYTAAAFNGSYNKKNYGHYVAVRNKMSFSNRGISGSTMAITKEHIDSPGTVPITERSPFSYQRYLEIPSDTDYLTIWFGINDASHTYLGTVNDTTNETFYGAWNVVLQYYLTNMPFLHLGLIVTTGATAEYRQAVRDVARKWGYPYMDWVDDPQIPAFFQRDGMSSEAQTLRRAAYGYNDYNAHPSPQWHQYASTAYENFLRTL